MAPHIPHVLYVFTYLVIKEQWTDHSVQFWIKSVLDLSIRKAHNYTPVCYEQSFIDYVLYKNDKITEPNSPVRIYVKSGTEFSYVSHLPAHTFLLKLLTHKVSMYSYMAYNLPL